MNLVFLLFATFTVCSVPKIVWTFWEGTPPPLIRSCWNNWISMNKDISFHFLNMSSFEEYVLENDLEVTEILGKIKGIPRKTDFIRLYLLKIYGGFWIDASIIMTGSLDSVINYIEANNADGFMFYLEGWSNHIPGVLESWFIASSKNKFISEWYDEFTTAVLNYGDEGLEYVKELQYSLPSVEFNRIFQNIPRTFDFEQNVNMRKYLTIVLTGMKVANEFNFVMLPAEQGPYYTVSNSGWDYAKAAWKLCNEDDSDNYNMPMVKLNHVYRRFLMEVLSVNGGCKENSVVGKYLQIDYY